MLNDYVREKLLEIEHDRALTRPLPEPAPPVTRRRPLAPVARLAGRRFRALGEALEGWASPDARPAGERRLAGWTDL